MVGYPSPTASVEGDEDTQATSRTTTTITKDHVNDTQYGGYDVRPSVTVSCGRSSSSSSCTCEKHPDGSQTLLHCPNVEEMYVQCVYEYVAFQNEVLLYYDMCMLQLSFSSTNRASESGCIFGL